MRERIESLKAGIVGGISLCLACLIATAINYLFLGKYFPALSNSSILTLNPNLQTNSVLVGLTLGIATFSGFLFGVTYRYIIRQDNNPHLKSGGVMAFGLVRGLGEVEMGFNTSDSIVPFLILAGESVLWFAVAGTLVDITIKLHWIKPFSSN